MVSYYFFTFRWKKFHSFCLIVIQGLKIEIMAKHKTQKRLETRWSKYHLDYSKAKAMEYYDFKKTIFQEQVRDYYRNLSEV